MRRVNPLKRLDGFLTGLGGERGFRGTVERTPPPLPGEEATVSKVRKKQAPGFNHGGRVPTELLIFIRVRGA